MFLFLFQSNINTSEDKWQKKQGNLLKLKRVFKTKNKKKQQGLFCIIHCTKQKSEKEVRLLTEVNLKKNQRLS